MQARRSPRTRVLAAAATAVAALAMFAAGAPLPSAEAATKPGVPIISTTFSGYNAEATCLDTAASWSTANGYTIVERCTPLKPVNGGYTSYLLRYTTG